MASPPVDGRAPGPSRGTVAGPGAEVGGTAGIDYVGLLPHRPPFLFVDVVDGCEPGRSCSGRYRVTGDEPFLVGHFPGNPVVPGVLQLEALAQVGAVALRAHPDFADRLPLFGGVEKARFRRIVRPGDELALQITIERLSSRGGWGDARASVAGATVCDARILFTFAPGA